MSKKADTDNEEFAQDYIEYITSVKGHDCILPQSEPPIINYIYHGLFVELRRKFRNMQLVNPNDPNSKAKLKSTAKIREDQERHLKYYYHMIHPYSKSREIWETFMIVIYLIEFTVVPFDIALRLTPPEVFFTKLICDVIFLIDCCLWFFTGYFNEQEQKIILNQRKVAWRYFLSYIFFDFGSSLPANYVIISLKLHKNPDSMWIYVKILSVFRIIRVPTFSKYLENFLERRKVVSIYYLKLLRTILALIIIFVWGIALRYYLGGFPTSSNRMSSLLFGTREVFSKLMLVGVGRNEKSEGINHKLCELLFLVCGCFLTKHMLVQVLNIYKRKSGAQNQHDKSLRQIEEYMKYKQLPQKLRLKIYHYLDFKFQKRIYKEDDILSLLSSKLVQEVLSHKCRLLVENVDLFKGIHTAIIMKLVSKLRSEIFLPNDTIVQAGIFGNSMYFIAEGTVALYTTAGKEVGHLHNADYFSEIALFTREPRIITVVAVHECELYRLTRKEFQDVMVSYPSVFRRMKQDVVARLKKIEEVKALNL